MAKKPVSEKQLEMYHFIREYIRDNSYPPSVREIGARTGLKSTSTVHAHLRRLEELGYIRRNPAISRAIEIVEQEPSGARIHSLSVMEPRDSRLVTVPLVGRVTAGQPIDATENIEDVYQLPLSLVGTPDVYMLKVAGDSMVDAGIRDGDLAIVRQTSSASNGDIVVALLDSNEATIKRFYREKDRFRLQPENPSMDPIYTDQVDICGRVIAVYRDIH